MIYKQRFTKRAVLHTGTVLFISERVTERRVSHRRLEKRLYLKMASFLKMHF